MSERLDVAMVAKGLAQSREKARALIMAGVVYVEGARADKAGMPVGDAVKTTYFNMDPVWQEDVLAGWTAKGSES